MAEELDGSKSSVLSLYTPEERGTAPDRSRSLALVATLSTSGALLYTAALSLGLLASLR